MANPAVEKLKNLGIRHGEKVGVALVAAFCLVAVVMAWSRESVDVTPDQIEKTASAAQANLNREQSLEDIQTRLNEAGLVPPDLVEQVVLAQKQQQAGDVKLAFAGPPFTYPEPGAGLIRETPQLVAPEDLFVTAGRGALRVFKTDDEGNLVYAEPKKDEPKKASTKSRRGRSMSGSGGMMSMMGMPGYGGMGAPPGGALSEEERKKQEEAERQRIAQMLVGTPQAEIAEEIDQKAQQGLTPEETTFGYRWVSIVGKLDHQQIRDNYASALKNPDAQPHYLRLDLQRRELIGSEGDQWGEWTDVDRESNQKILAYVTHKDEELAPEEVRLEGLVDMLPFLQVGAYKGVHYGPLIPAEKITPRTPPAGTMAGYGGMMSMMGSMAGYGGMMGGSGGYGGMMGMAGYGGMMGSVDQGNFPKSNAPELMIRSLDFTVTPDTAYQYRVRVVVANPNLDLDSVRPGTDTKSKELAGPWSEPTAPVRVPADVTTYAVGPTPGNPESIRFQVASFDEATGLTVVRTFDGEPGDFIGAVQSAPVPREDGEGRRSAQIDFTSRQILLDAAAGQQPLKHIGRSGTTFDSPALALVMRPDGMLVVRDQTRDTHDPEMKQMQDIYSQILKDADEGGKKPKGGSMMDMYMGMMGGYGGYGR